MSSGPFNYLPSPDLRQADSVSRFKLALQRAAESIRVALPAVVQQFYPGPPATVDVAIATNENLLYSESDQVISMVTDPSPLPKLTGIPVAIFGAGTWSLTFPVQPGDECLLIIPDTPISVWFQNGGLNNMPIAQRRHSLSDAIAIFGLRSTPRALSSYSTTSAQLRSEDGSVVVDLAPSQITVTAPTVAVNAQTVDLNGSSQVNVTGGSSVTIAGSGQTKIEGRLFLQHEHVGVTPGSGTSGFVL